MPVKFIGYIGFNDNSEISAPTWSTPLDKGYVEAAARAQEDGGFDSVLVPFASHWPESQIVTAHAAALTTRLAFLVAHRPGFTQPTLAARQLATLDELSGGRVAVHIITGAADEEMARDGDRSTKEERYARTDEYMHILKRQWTATEPFDHDGGFYFARGAFSGFKPKNIPVFFGGSSPAAIDVAGRHADVYALWGETIAQVRESVAAVAASAVRQGRKRPGFSLSLRPVIAGTEEAAWKKADEIVERFRDLRQAAGLATEGHTPPNAGSQRLLDAARQGYRLDKCLWTGVAAVGGGMGSATGLVGTPEQVADAMLDYYDLGIDHFLIRGFEPLKDSIEYGRDLLPIVHHLVAARDSEPHRAAG